VALAEEVRPAGGKVVIEILPEQSTQEQLLNRVRSLARELAEAKAALAAAEGRENDLIDRIRAGL
jgi:hypothetical protein